MLLIVLYMQRSRLYQQVSDVVGSALYAEEQIMLASFSYCQ
jgi:hypothetical protein